MEKFKLGSRFYYQTLNDNDKRIYRDIYDEWTIGKDKISIYVPGVSFNTSSGREIHEIVKYVINENPHIFHLETTQFSYLRRGSYIEISAKTIYTQEEYISIYRRLLNRVDSIMLKVNAIHDEESKLKFIHDYLAENIIYDYGAPDAKSQREVHTIVGSLLNGACVCDGYARAFRLLCDQARISNIVVIGDAKDEDGGDPHAWNIVKLRGIPYQVDVTWDSNLSKNHSEVKDYYYLRGDLQFASTHSWNSDFYPSCAKDYPRRYPLLIDKYQLEHHICKMINSGKKKFVLCLDKGFPNKQVFKDLVRTIMRRNKAVFNSYRSYSFTFYERMDLFTYVDIEFLE